jgi:hypothetical protein
VRLPQLRRVRWAVRSTLTLGVAASVTANVLHAQQNPISQAIAAWPPLALLLTVELISRVPVLHRSLAATRLVATATIAGIAAWVSYWHMAGVAARYGEVGASPYLLPLSVDGLIIVASICLVELGGRIGTAEDGQPQAMVAIPSSSNMDRPWNAEATTDATTMEAAARSATTAMGTTVADAATMGTTTTGTSTMGTATADATPAGEPAVGWRARAEIAAVLAQSARSSASTPASTPAGRPANGSSANGTSANGTSANGTSVNSTPANRTSANGRKAQAAPPPQTAPPQQAAPPPNGQPRSGIKAAATSRTAKATSPSTKAAPAPRQRRPVAETAALAAEIEAQRPDATAADVAEELGITPARLRAILRQQTRELELAA